MPDQQIPSNSPDSQVLDRYRAMLRAHDWYFEYSDDYRVWQLGRLAQEQLEFLRRELDPDYAIWNTIAPEDCRCKAAAAAADPRAHFPLDQEPSA